MRNKKLIYFLVVCMLTTIMAFNYEKKPVRAASEMLEEFFDFINITELREGQFYTMVDDDDNVILQTARIMHVGDQFLNNKNQQFRVYEVDRENLTAKARFIRDVDLAAKHAKPEPNFWAALFSRFNIGNQTTSTENTGPIAIYHSHSAESYVPTDGTESIEDNGGIYDVGAAFKNSLEARGIEVVYSENNHDPHDAGSYKRSRRTVDELLNEDPAAIFDVHRDAVPAEQYAGEADGEEVAQVMFVVGQQNQNQAETMSFAEGLKNVADEQNPELIKGIFEARGNYNQDMSPRALLLEAGTYTQDKDLAISGIESFTDVVVSYVYGDEPDQSSPQASPGAGDEQAQTPAARDTARGGGRTILWILGIAAVGGIAFLAINSGGLGEVGSKLKNFTTKEFTNTLKGKPKKKKKKK
ncbi:stage II sporulation protein P [Alkalicella caledoniensis]|uniref:Stage II sporulation protein P n=1 Tax=Alkalicella caledoniensis TaxID=2731377 RepID=A0A7G9W4C2_ALKCA|nr:stage II sporulation protein P [Alkalicella caledoniensis]QNO13534.1 stage II sporulation protein P [Alkalicella caledoniensis]